MPSDKQLIAVADIVIGFYPELAACSNMGIHQATPEVNRREWRKQFAASFVALASMGRLESPDRRHYWWHHKDNAEGILRAIGRPETLYFEAFVCACLARGDIPHSGIGVQFLHTGVVPELGLASQHAGRMPTAASWRRVLESGKILAATPPAIRPAARSPSSVTQLQMTQPTVF
jgi:hypothetical protein